ncbi:unnamed protein product [Knipowitschia caucasica]
MTHLDAHLRDGQVNQRTSSVTVTIKVNQGHKLSPRTNISVPLCPAEIKDHPSALNPGHSSPGHSEIPPRRSGAPQWILDAITPKADTRKRTLFDDTMSDNRCRPYMCVSMSK